jgi:molybdate transport system substrate-binding protein
MAIAKRSETLMLKKKFKLLGVFVCALFIFLTACQSESAPTGAPAPAETQSPPAAETAEILVSAAASLTDAMNELAALYKTVAPNVTVTYTFGSSGALQTQIEEGAPADLFMSAAQKQMDALSEKGLIDEATRRDLLVNEVVLIVPKDSEKTLAFESITDVGVSKIALGDPASVPVGQYAEEVFAFLNSLDAVKEKAIYGSDVRQVLTWVESGEVDCGVVYATDAAISENVKVAVKAPEGSHKTVVYPAAVIKESKHPGEAAAFLDFLSTGEAGAVFEKYGFTLK